MARWLLGSLLVLACTGLMPAGAAAAPGLASEDRAFPAPVLDSTDVDAAFAPNGFAAVAWIERVTDEGVVNVVLRAPGQDWSAPTRLSTRVSPSDPPSGRTLGGVDVAVNANGDAAVTWEEGKSPSTFTVAISSRPAGGAFRRPELLDPATIGRVGVDASGVVTLLTGFDTAANDRTQVLTAPAGASFLGLPAQVLSTACGPFEGDLAVAPSGDAVLGFSCNGIAFSVRRNGTWSTSTPFINSFVTCPTIGTTTTFSSVRVDIDGQGHPIGVVLRSDFSSNCSMFPQTTRSNRALLAIPAGGVMVAGPEVAASGTGAGFSNVPNSVGAPAVGIGGGSVVVGWGSGNDNGALSRPATRTYPENGAGAPGPPEPIGSFVGRVGEVEAGVDSAGRTLVAWTQLSAGTSALLAAFRPQGGAFGQPLPVNDPSADAGGISAGVSDAGDGVIGFLQGPTSGPGRVAHARGFDATAPQLTGVSIPPTAEVGVPAPFIAGAFDVWGPVSFAWDFGDGTATGATPAHAFSSAGQASVTVTATDSAGNSSAQSGGVAVRRVPPRITNLSATNVVFRARTTPTGTAAARRRRAPVGTTFRFRLDRPASVAMTIARALPGRRSGRRCVKPTRRLARARRCTRFDRRGTLRRAGELGANRLAFSGRIGRSALKPGKYRAAFVATAGGVSSKASSLRFRVVR